MYPYEIESEDLVNQGKILVVTCPNSEVKRVSVRFPDDCITEEQKTLAIENVVNEIVRGYGQDTIVFQTEGRK